LPREIKYQTTYKPSRRRKRKIPRYAKAFFAAVGVYLLFLFLMNGYQIWQAKLNIKELNLQKERLLQEQKELENERDSLHDPEVIEKLARESLGFVKPGETLIVPAVPKENVPEPK
jgi:cell division protein DivIC